MVIVKKKYQEREDEEVNHQEKSTLQEALILSMQQLSPYSAPQEPLDVHSSPFQLMSSGISDDSTKTGEDEPNDGDDTANYPIKTILIHA